MKKWEKTAPAFVELSIKENDFNSYILNGEKKKCLLCGTNGSVRKYVLTIFYRFKIRVCFPCIMKHGSAGNIAQYIEKNFKIPKQLYKTNNLNNQEGLP